MKGLFQEVILFFAFSGLKTGVLVAGLAEQHGLPSVTFHFYGRCRLCSPCCYIRQVCTRSVACRPVLLRPTDLLGLPSVKLAGIPVAAQLAFDGSRGGAVFFLLV